MIQTLTKCATVIAFLICSTGFTQIQITNEQALEAVRNAQRVETLKTDLRSAEVIILSQGELIETLKGEVSKKDLIIALTNKNYDILQTQYDALKKEKNPSYKFSDFLQDAGKVLIGVVVGVGIVLLL